MDELNNDVIEVIEESIEVMEPEVIETSSGPNKLAIGIGLAAVGGVAAILYKNRKRFEALRIEKLRKKGYIIQDPKDHDEVTSDEDEVEYEIVEE